MDIPQLNALSNYWAQNPPVHILVARYMGYKGEGSTLAESAPEDITEQEYIPATKLSAAEFDELLVSKGIPAPNKANTEQGASNG